MTPGAAAASLAAAIVFEVVGTTALQASKGFTRLGPGLVTVAAYGLAVWLLGRALLAIPVGVAYAVWSGLGVVLIALIGRVLFAQRLDAPALLGMALIVAGVLVIHLFSQSVR
jgi:small multidrug resistance pump